MDQRVYKGPIEKLRTPKHLQLLEVERVVELSLEKLFVTKVLDIGSGTGVFAEAFALRKLNVVGIDKNPAMVQAASTLVHSCSFQEATAEALPFAKKSFDLLFLGHVLHESDNPLLTLKEAQRVAASRVAVLEWPYRQEETGPPLSLRIKPETVKKLASRAGMVNFEKIDLSCMVLYRMQPAA